MSAYWKPLLLFHYLMSEVTKCPYWYKNCDFTLFGSRLETVSYIFTNILDVKSEQWLINMATKS